MIKQILIAALCLLPLTSAAQKQKQGVVYDAEITRVVDGDTVAFRAPFLPAPLKPELSIRIFGVDTPEKGHRAKCPQEAAQGAAATEFTKQAVAQAKTRQIILMGWDKYGGRVLGDVLLNGQSLRMMLIQQGLAREYYGDAKTSWCK